MAFKQKSGSPFLRNFGVGKSPAKQQSPMKNIYPAKEMVKINDKGMYRKMDAHNAQHEGDMIHDDEGSTWWNKNEEMPEKAQNETEYTNIDGSPKKDDQGKPVVDPTALEMKSSGFKMKSSPFNRNFGIGDTPSPMKRAEIELDGEVISAADYKKYKQKDAELEGFGRGESKGMSIEQDSEGQKVYKEHFGDNFMTQNEWLLSQNPGSYIGEDGEVEIEHEGGMIGPVDKNHSGYADYFSSFDEKFETDKTAEQDVHRGGTHEGDWKYDKETTGSGITGAANINLTGSDFINDLKLQHQDYYGDKLKKGEAIPSFRSWMKEMGGETEDTYKEALAFEEFKAEKGLSGEDALTAWRNREDLTDQ